MPFTLMSGGKFNNLVAGWRLKDQSNGEIQGLKNFNFCVCYNK